MNLGLILQRMITRFLWLGKMRGEAYRIRPTCASRLHGLSTTSKKRSRKALETIETPWKLESWGYLNFVT